MVSSVNDFASAAEADPGLSAIGAELLAVISAIRRIARRTVRQAWSAEPLPPAQGELLRLADARPGITVAEAAQELRLAPNTVSTLVGRLADAGLLDRSRDSADGRTVRLAVSAAGVRRFTEFRDLRAELAGQALEQLSTRDRRVIADAVPALQRFAEQLEKESL
jgi:DNA-binding MarR family transcriptional regulator